MGKMTDPFFSLCHSEEQGWSKVGRIVRVVLLLQEQRRYIVPSCVYPIGCAKRLMNNFRIRPVCKVLASIEVAAALRMF